MTTNEIIGLIVLLIALFSQASWIFYDANKRGESKWLWGFFGLIQLPSSLIIYLLVTRRLDHRINCIHCNSLIPDDSIYCPYCGKTQK